MEDTSTVELTEFVPPVDTKTRQELTRIEKHYMNAVRDPKKPWGNGQTFQKKHDDFPEFRRYRYRSFFCQKLLNKPFVEKLGVVELFRMLQGLGIEVDRNIFTETCEWLYGYFSRKAKIAAKYAPSPA